MTRTVAVLMGGWSPEREVSLVSGKACAEGLREGGHKVVEYDVKRDLRALVEFLRPAAGGGPDVVFNALHGSPGDRHGQAAGTSCFRVARLARCRGSRDRAPIARGG